MTNNSALDPFSKHYYITGEEEDDSFYKQFQDFLTRYYIGISDFRGKGLLVDCGLPRRIEKYLSLLGKVLAIEQIGNSKKVLLARLAGNLVVDFSSKSIIKCDFILIGDNEQEKYQVRLKKP